MGHGLNNTIQDTLVRKHRMMGQRVKWILGTDHAGIATQSVVEKELRKEGVDRHELGREAFVERVWEWREQYGGTIIEQLKRLGVSGDFDNERFTLDDGYVVAVYRVFVALYEKGLIYRDNYMVNWDPGSNSAISDLEVENREVEDVLYSIDYPIEGSDRALTVATVRPETMLADTAVAVNPADERYRELVGGHCILPLVGRRLPIIADEHVDVEFGTGALKITPGHDQNDFEIGRRHGLEEISVIGEDGRLSDAAGPDYAGLSVGEAQERIVAALREAGAISGEEPYTHSVPFSHRSGERIEPLDQPAVVLPDGRAREAGHRRRQATAGSASRRSAGGGSTSTGWRRSGPGASRGSSGGATSCRSGTAIAASSPLVAETRARAAVSARSAAARCAVTRTCSIPGSARRSGRSPRSAGPRTLPSCAPSTRPMRSSRRATSSTSGSRG